MAKVTKYTERRHLKDSWRYIHSILLKIRKEKLSYTIYGYGLNIHDSEIKINWGCNICTSVGFYCPECSVMILNGNTYMGCEKLPFKRFNKAMQNNNLKLALRYSREMINEI